MHQDSEDPIPQDERDRLFGLAYEELRRLAATVRRNGATPTLNPTALVHEAFIKLSGSLRIRPESKQHFRRLVARAMRQVLVEAARTRTAAKRGGGDMAVTFDERHQIGQMRADQILDLDEALNDLAELDPRQACVIECRFFGGYSVEDTAKLLDVSTSTVDRDWSVARAWLKLQMKRSGE